MEKLYFTSLDPGRGGRRRPWQSKELPLSRVKDGQRHRRPYEVPDLYGPYALKSEEE